MSSPASISAQSELPEHTARCASCSATLAGPYCSQCGEQVIDHHALTMRHFLTHGLLHELSHFDGKIFSSFRFLLFRPGFLSQEYFAGRRRKFVNPIRLLLTSALIFALAVHGSYMSMNVGRLRLNLVPPGTPSEATISDTIKKIDVLGMVSRFAQWRGRTTDLNSEGAAEKFNHELKTYGTALSFCNVGLLALFLFAIYHRRRPLFLEHLVFSFHLASFVLLFTIVPAWFFRLMVMLTNARLLPVAVIAGTMLVLGTESLYVYRALLRFYRPDLINLRWWNRPSWAVRGAVVLVFLANSVFITVTYAAGAAIALMRL